MHTEQTALIITVQVQRGDGFLYAASPEVPGLHVCGTTADELQSSLVRAVRELFKRNKGVDVVVTPASETVDEFPCTSRAARPAGRMVVHLAA